MPESWVFPGCVQSGLGNALDVASIVFALTRSGQGRRDFAGVNMEGASGQTPVYVAVGLGIGGAFSLAQGGKEEVEAGSSVVLGRQPVPHGKEFRGTFGLGMALVAGDLRSQPGAEFPVVVLPVLELAFLVAFDELLIEVPGKREPTHQQRVEGWQIQQVQIGLCGPEMRPLESDQVVAEQDLGAFSEPVAPVQRRLKDYAVAGKDKLPLMSVCTAERP